MGWAGRMRAAAAAFSVHGVGQPLAARPEHDPFLAVADEPGLHQQFDIAIGVGAGHVEPGGATLRPFAQELLDEAVADVAGIGQADRIELHDGPLVAGRLALDADQAGDAVGAFVHVHQVVGPERAERQAEQAEDADRRAADRQPERARGRRVRLAQPRQLAEGGQVGQASGADLARPARWSCRRHRAPVIEPASAASGAGVGPSLRPGRHARSPSSP